MAKKKKVYAVKKGRQTGIFDTWEACKSQIHGFAGAVYKSFETRQEAESYLERDYKQQSAPTDDGDHLIAYVDGSFDSKIRRYSYGCVFLTPDGRTVRKSGSGNDPSFWHRLVTKSFCSAQCHRRNAGRYVCRSMGAEKRICRDGALL